MVNQSLFPKALSPGETLDPIRSLWRNVLITALEDAIGRHWRNKTYGNPRNDYFVQSARDYFLHPKNQGEIEVEDEDDTIQRKTNH